MEERRRFIRVKAPVMIEFPNPATMKTERSFTTDVSDTGVRFPTPVRLQVGQELPLTFQLPYEHPTGLQASGHVVWVREIARIAGPQYEVGVRFRWVDDPARRRLGRYLHAVFTGNL
jgi:c-di-GMP-binding flagellar brake protein YcgR